MSDDLPRVLCVDDEPNLLAALQRNLYEKYELTTAPGGAAALLQLRNNGPFEVIVSDMRMPNMDGATFLAAARGIAPDSVRILLTGQADTQSAIKAINEGAIFRYLTKPCSKEALIKALDAAVAHYRLQQAERGLLESTLAAAVKTMCEVLSMVAPLAFQRATFAQSCVRHALTRLGWPDAWMYDLAAALCQIGCVGIPADVIQDYAALRELEPERLALYEGHPETAYKLLSAIPRLERVAEIVRYQAVDPPPEASMEIRRGAQLLRAALELQRHMMKNAPARPLAVLRAMEPALPDSLIQALADYRVNLSGSRSVKVRELMPGWIADEDVVCLNGIMLLAAGSEITETAIATMQRLVIHQAIHEPIRVRCTGVPVA